MMIILLIHTQDYRRMQRWVSIYTETQPRSLHSASSRIAHMPYLTCVHKQCDTVWMHNPQIANGRFQNVSNCSDRAIAWNSYWCFNSSAIYFGYILYFGEKKTKPTFSRLVGSRHALLLQSLLFHMFHSHFHSFKWISDSLKWVRWKTRSAGCGVWKMRSVESAVWKMRSVENMKLTNNLIPLYSHWKSVL